MIESTAPSAPGGKARRPPCRNVQATRARILDGVGSLLAREGFGALGLNAVAREAGVDKVLIYRYFGGLEGLLEAYALAGSFWPTLEELVPDSQVLQAMPLAERMGTVFRRFLAGLRSRPLTLEILAWEGVARSPLTRALDTMRERQGLQLVELLAPGADPGPGILLATVFGAAVQNLLVRARHVDHYNGMDLRQDATWEAIAVLMERLAGSLEAVDRGR